MDAKHTPGPWSVLEVRNLDGEGWAREIEAADLTVALIYADVNMDADARLIAAAPDMYAALLAVLPDLQHYVDTHGAGPDVRLAALRAALAKADGR
jgi:hypothetical protein